MNASDILSRVLKYSGVLALALIVVGGILGYVLAGGVGLISVLIGTATAVLFSAITAGSLLAAIKLDVVAFFGIVMGSWLLKMVLFIILLLTLRGQSFIDPLALFLSLVVAIVGTVTIDAIVVMRSRMPYVSNVSLPGDDENRSRES